jgi:DNA-binding IclR family transcriptional regulator
MSLQRQIRSKGSGSRQLSVALQSSKAPAISRAFAVLRLLGEHERPLSLHAIADELGLPHSTCLYVLRVLLAEEVVSFDPDTKKYSQEAGVLTLARQWLRRNQFIRFAQPVMDSVSQRFNVTVAGMQIVGLHHIVVVAVSQAHSTIQLSMQIGSRFPALISATGRCVAAFGGHADIDIESRFRLLRWDEPISFDQWKLQVRRTRTQGFAVDESNYMSGLTVIAVPVWARGKLTHAIVAVGTSSALERSGFTKLTTTLLKSARTLTDQLRGDASD